jgi:hypothetical protein
VTIRKLVIVLAILIAAYQLGIRGGVFPGVSHSSSHESAESASRRSATGDALSDAYDHHLSNVQVEASGIVSRVLPDDNDGSRHQRFIVRMPSGQTVLIAHNIDLAPPHRKPARRRRDLLLRRIRVERPRRRGPLDSSRPQRPPSRRLAET